jgi:hypothetical protein
VAADTGRSMNVTHPGTGNVIGKVPEMVGAEQDRDVFIAHEIVDDLPKLAPRQETDAQGGLAQAEQVGRAHRSARQPQFLLHPARQPAGQPPGEGTERSHLHQPGVAALSVGRRDAVHVGVGPE